MRFGTSEGHADLYDALVMTLEAIGDSPANASIDAALAGAWRIVSEMGFAPALDSCASCHAVIAEDAVASFSHPAGGVLCQRCTSLAGTSRVLPAHARAALRAWVVGARATVTDGPSRRAHQRLLREFLSQHLADGRPLRAYDVWERNSWAGTVEAGT